MPHSFGLRARTRSKFSRNFREHGAIPLSTYMKTYKVGDIVDIKANAAVQKGMPHKFYHGRTGVVFNVTKSAVGVIVNKRVGSRFIEKLVNIRIEHVKHSKSRQGHLDRVDANDKATEEFKKTKPSKEEFNAFKRTLMRHAQQPRESRLIVASTLPETLTPAKYETLI